MAARRAVRPRDENGWPWRWARRLRPRLPRLRGRARLLGVWPLFAVYGAYIAATEGVAKAWVADHAPGGTAGTAYGLFAVASGAALLVASIVAGVLWDHVSPESVFALGAASAGLALVLMLGLRARRLV